MPGIESPPPPEGKPVPFLCRYFAAIPQLSVDTDALSGPISEVLWTFRVDDHRREAMRLFLELPEDAAKLTISHKTEAAGQAIHSFAQASGLLVGRLANVNDSTISGHDKLELMRAGRGAVQYLSENYCQPKPKATDDSPHPPLSLFHNAIYQALTMPVAQSITAALHPPAVGDETFDAVISQAIFLADAGEEGFLYPGQYEKLRAAWNTSDYKDLINTTPFGPLQKGES